MKVTEAKARALLKALGYRRHAEFDVLTLAARMSSVYMDTEEKQREGVTEPELKRLLKTVVGCERKGEKVEIVPTPRLHGEETAEKMFLGSHEKDKSKYVFGGIVEQPTAVNLPNQAKLKPLGEVTFQGKFEPTTTPFSKGMRDLVNSIPKVDLSDGDKAAVIEEVLATKGAVTLILPKAKPEKKDGGKKTYYVKKPHPNGEAEFGVPTAKKPHKPGTVFRTIFEELRKGTRDAPVTKDQILEVLVAHFPKKQKASLAGTLNTFPYWVEMHYPYRLHKKGKPAAYWLEPLPGVK